MVLDPPKKLKCIKSVFHILSVYAAMYTYTAWLQRVQ